MIAGHLFRPGLTVKIHPVLHLTNLVLHSLQTNQLFQPGVRVINPSKGLRLDVIRQSRIRRIRTRHNTAAIAAGRLTRAIRIRQVKHDRHIGAHQIILPQIFITGRYSLTIRHDFIAAEQIIKRSQCLAVSVFRRNISNLRIQAIFDRPHLFEQTFQLQHMKLHSPVRSQHGQGHARNDTPN